MKVTHVLIDSIKPYPKNYNKHPESQVDSLAASAAEFEQVKNIVVWRGSIIAGEGFWRGMVRAGQKRIAVADVSEWTEAKARAYMVADNEIAKLAEPDMAELAALLDGLKSKDFDLAALAAGGVDNLKALTLSAIQQGDADPQFDRAAELQEKWQVKTGDLWRIGEHRLLCGDITKREDVERVMQGEKADCVLTDPPYRNTGMSGGGFANNKVYQDEFVRGMCDFDPALFLSGIIHCLDRYNLVAFCSRDLVPVYSKFATDNGLTIDFHVWHKVNAIPFTSGTFKSDIEYIVLIYAKGRFLAQTHNQADYSKVFQSALITNQDTKNHPTEKPLSLISKYVRLLGDDSARFFDPFAGSGTTLVACQNLGRRCRAIEIAPQYVAVCMERMAMAFPGIEIERLD